MGLLDRPEVDRVTYLHLEFIGPGRVYLVAAVDMSGDEVEHNVAVRLRAVERELEEADDVEEAVITLARRTSGPCTADRRQAGRPRTISAASEASSTRWTRRPSAARRRGPAAAARPAAPGPVVAAEQDERRDRLVAAA